MNRCCTPEKQYIINRGAKFTAYIVGKFLDVGDTYKGVLYHDARNEENRAETSGIVEPFGEDAKLILNFPGEETIKLKSGSTVIIEFYNEGKTKMGYKENFAKVRPTSINM